MTDVAALCDRLVGGDRRALARVLTLVEDGAPELRRRVVGLLHPRRRGARLIGITGPPGAGKSTVTSALVATLRAAGRSVAVLAIDPSSPLTGGALLGDRIRMQGHHADAGVYVRSMAARGHLGGLAVAAPEAAMVLDAAGFDDVVVETVGVGQSEVDVMGLVDAVVLVLAPGLGDSVQAAKAGVLEVADVLVVNKADLGGAGKLESELHAALALGHAAGGPAEVPPVVRTVAVRGEGLDELVAAVDAHVAGAAPDATRGRRRLRRWLLEQAAAGFRAELAGPSGPRAAELDRLVDLVETGTLDPATAAARLLPPAAGPDA